MESTVVMAVVAAGSDMMEECQCSFRDLDKNKTLIREALIIDNHLGSTFNIIEYLV